VTQGSLLTHERARGTVRSREVRLVAVILVGERG